MLCPHDPSSLGTKDIANVLFRCSKMTDTNGKAHQNLHSLTIQQALPPQDFWQHTSASARQKRNSLPQLRLPLQLRLPILRSSKTYINVCLHTQKLFGFKTNFAVSIPIAVTTYYKVALWAPSLKCTAKRQQLNIFVLHAVH